MNSRENGFDLMRVIAALCVVFMHSSALMIANTSTYELSALAVYTQLAVFGKASVGFFFMVSGAFVLSSPRTQDLKSFYPAMFRRLCLPTIVFTFVYFAADVVYMPATGGTLSGCFEALITGEGWGTHLWFMVAMIAMYLAAPMIQFLKDRISLCAFTVTAIALIVLGFLNESTSPHKLVFDFGFAVSLIGEFMLGYTIYARFREKKSAGKALLLLASALLAGAGLIIAMLYGVCRTLPVLSDLFSIKDTSPFIILIAALLTAGMLKLPIKKDFTKVSSLTYGVYLVHMLFIVAGRFIFSAIKGVPVQNLVLNVPEAMGLAATVSVLSFALTALYYKFFKKKTQK